MTDYAIGTPMGDAVYGVRQSGAREWQIVGGLVADDAPDGTASGYIFERQGSRVAPYAFVVDETGAEGMVEGADLWAAVEAFAHATRMVEATEEGRAIAADWQSPGGVGAVLAQFASTGRARLDQFSYDAERTRATESQSVSEMEALLTPGLGYRECITVRSIAESVTDAGMRSLETIAHATFAKLASEAPHLITSADDARQAFADIVTAYENTEGDDESGDPAAWPV